MHVSVDIDQVDVDGDYTSVDGLCLTCSKCGHSVEVFGTSEASAKRGAIMLREQCPNNESNYYDVDHWT
jgi:riboflavin synthase alpha subunit